MLASFQVSQYHGLDFGLAVLLDAVLRPFVDQVAPLLVVLRGVGPAGVDLVVLRGRRPRVLVGLRLHRHRLRHEADLDVRLDAALEIGVEDAVDDRPVVDRLAAGIFGVGVGRSPLQRRRAVAGDQQAVGAEEAPLRRQLADARRSASCRPSCRRSSARRRRRTARSASAARSASPRRRGWRRRKALPALAAFARAWTRTCRRSRWRCRRAGKRGTGWQRGS